MSINATLIIENKTYQGILTEVSPLSDEIKLVWITDTQTRYPSIHPERWEAIDKAVNHANEWGDYFVFTGDMASGDWQGLQATFDRVNDNLTVPFLWCLGNHDEEEYTYGVGNPNTSAIEQITGRLAPFYFSQIIFSSDDSLRALVLTLDCNFYDDSPPSNATLISENHQPGDRVGTVSGEPPGGWWRQFGQDQINWVESELANNPECNAIILLCHYITVGARPTDWALLGDVLQADNRSKIILAGHRHKDADTWQLKDTNESLVCLIYKTMGLADCLGHCNFRLAYENGEIAIREASLDISIVAGNVESPFSVGV